MTAWGQELCHSLPRSVTPHSWIVGPDLFYRQVQQQTDSFSCSLFTYTLCEGVDPSQMECELTTLWSPILQCIENYTSQENRWHQNLVCIVPFTCQLPVMRWFVAIHALTPHTETTQKSHLVTPGIVTVVYICPKRHTKYCFIHYLKLWHLYWYLNFWKWKSGL